MLNSVAMMDPCVQYALYKAKWQFKNKQKSMKYNCMEWIIDFSRYTHVSNVSYMFLKRMLLVTS